MNLKPIIILFCLIILGLFSAIACAAGENRLIVDVNWLKQYKNQPDVVVIDVRSARLYRQGHIPGAVNIPVSETFNPVKNTDRVANMTHIQQLFSNAGLKPDNTLVLYDAGSHIDAGRTFWVFEVFGHKKVKLLSGGFPAWTLNKNNPVSKKTPEITKTQYIPQLKPERMITRLSMQLALENRDRIIIDARSKEEYLGKKSIASRAGHIPGAINIPWDQNFTRSNGIEQLKSIDELKALYSPLDKNKKIYLYCNKGKQSSLSYLVLRQLGYDVGHYDGSWFEWGNNQFLPIEKQANP